VNVDGTRVVAWVMGIGIGIGLDWIGQNKNQLSGKNGEKF